jgi:hypothetical protein
MAKGVPRRSKADARQVAEAVRDPVMADRLKLSGYGGDVANQLARLKGSSRSDVASDADRGGSSPLGHGTGSREAPPKRKEKRR